MRKKPWFFNVVSLIFLLISISMPFQASMTIGERPLAFWQHLDKLTWINWVIFFLGVANSYLIFHVFGLVRVTIPLYFLVVFYNNSLVYSYHHEVSTPFIFLPATFFLALCLFWATRKGVYQLLNRPHLKWWSTSPRIIRNLPVIVHCKLQKNMKAKTYDVSLTGAFLTCLDDSWNVKINDEVVVTIDALGFYSNARIVRITFGKGNYPEGVGIRFENQSEHAKNLLNYFITGRPENLLLNTTREDSEL